jgi:hypothetical protein
MYVCIRGAKMTVREGCLLRSAALKGCKEIANDNLGQVVDLFCSFTEPDDGPTFLTMTRVGMVQPAYSRKPGNIVLNWRKFFESIPNTALASASLSEPWLMPFAALSIWNEFWKQSKIEVEPRHALLLEVMWQKRNQSRRVLKSVASAAVNERLSSTKLSQMSSNEFEVALNKLSALHCIEIETEEVWLREWVKVVV